MCLFGSASNNRFQRFILVNFLNQIIILDLCCIITGIEFWALHIHNLKTRKFKNKPGEWKQSKIFRQNFLFPGSVSQLSRRLSLLSPDLGWYYWNRSKTKEVFDMNSEKNRIK